MSSYISESVPVPLSVSAGAAIKVSPRSTLAVGLGGTFVGTVQFQWSPEKSGSTWNNLGAALTAAGFHTLLAGRAQRVRADTTAYTSGTPVGTCFNDSLLNAFLIERTFREEALEAPASVSAGNAVELEGGEQAIVSLSGTFTATLQLQFSLTLAGDDWYNWSVPLTAAGMAVVPRGLARRVRFNTTAWTSGAPVAKINHGFSAEMVGDNKVETVASGILSLYTRTSLLTISGTKAYTLAAGLYEGQRKSIKVLTAASTPVGTLTPSLYADAGTTIVFGAAGEGVELEWSDGAGWRRISEAVSGLGIPSGVNGVETVTSGDLDVAKAVSLISCTGTQAYALPNGTYDGQMKFIFVTVAASTPVGTLTPATTPGAATHNFSAVNEYYIFRWETTTGWRLVAAHRSQLAADTVASGACLLFTQTTYITVDGTKAYTLADGLYLGQLKFFRCTAAINTPDGTLTPANATGFTSLDFDAAEEAYGLRWDGAGWEVLYVIAGAVT